MKTFEEFYSKLPEILNPDRYMFLASSTQYIAYGCDFTKDGCKGRNGSNMCCCNGCRDSYGHFKYKFEGKKIPEFIIKNFNSDKTGFWRDEGCILPRKFRSITCLIHHCHCKETEYLGYLLDVIRKSLEEAANLRGW